MSIITRKTSIFCTIEYVPLSRELNILMIMKMEVQSYFKTKSIISYKLLNQCFTTLRTKLVLIFLDRHVYDKYQQK